MLKTDCIFLENELSDVERMFLSRPQTIEHTFLYKNGVFFNDFTVDGKHYSFKDVATPKDEVEYKRFERRYAKLGLYKILSKKYKEKLPWGALTGIRPTKLCYTETESGRDYLKTLKEMQVSRENIRLTRDVLQAQEGIYEKKEGNVDVFVSLPFCPSKCEYCSFITAPISSTRQYLDGYLKTLEKEAEESKGLIKNLRSIYIGGGTPFVLNEAELESVLKSVSKLCKDKVEYTVEAGRPDVFTDGKLKLLREYGVSRICINPQTFSDKTLKAIGRKHTVADVYKAFELANKYSFTVNLDLIAGLQGETVKDFSYSVDEAIKTGADNITVHCLCLKVGAKLKEETDFLTNPVISDMVGISREKLRKAGYEPYYLYRQKYQVGNNENVGWTKKGKQCIYNIDVMEEITDNLALGANAVSKKVDLSGNKIERFGTPKDIKTYLEKADTLIKERKKFFETADKN